MKEVSDEHSWPIALSKMKRMIAVMSLVLCMSMSLGVSASAASYVPDDITYQNLNGQQLAVKVFTLLPDQDPSDLIEADFEHDGYLYSYSDMVKEEQMFNEENIHKETVTVTTAKKMSSTILSKPQTEFPECFPRDSTPSIPARFVREIHSRCLPLICSTAQMRLSRC